MQRRKAQRKGILGRGECERKHKGGRGQDQFWKSLSAGRGGALQWWMRLEVGRGQATVGCGLY